MLLDQKGGGAQLIIPRKMTIDPEALVQPFPRIHCPETRELRLRSMNGSLLSGE